MSQTNSDIVRGYIEEVINKRRLDQIPVYFSQKAVGLGTPYVGMGITIDETNKVNITVRAVLAGSPAESRLKVGDEILEVQDGAQSWKTFDELRQPTWGRGPLGTSLTLRIKRDGREQEISVVRGMVEGYNMPIDDLRPMLATFFEEWPEHHLRLVEVLESGDRVSYFGENQGRNSRYNRSAVWSECGILRIQNGKISEMRFIEDDLSQMKQLGYTIQSPVPVHA